MTTTNREEIIETKNYKLRLVNMATRGKYSLTPCLTMLCEDEEGKARFLEEKSGKKISFVDSEESGVTTEIYEKVIFAPTGVEKVVTLGMVGERTVGPHERIKEIRINRKDLLPMSKGQ